MKKSSFSRIPCATACYFAISEDALGSFRPRVAKRARRTERMSVTPTVTPSSPVGYCLPVKARRRRARQTHQRNPPSLPRERSSRAT
ncbi:hypothetical protein EYF80_065991 [Liparis tanakae]|uniref:Uncharacterized protein n=1 Tax=Liparis tanakae TaxID=230148 RepID=A0A4Z2E596_9TELE|nr:hypothetical protein EYF80_065991 [Liparis tanakae]